MPRPPRARRTAAPKRPPEDPERAALDQALRLISIRARTRHELTEAWTRKELPEEAQRTAMARLEGWGYLDDERFAHDRARALLNAGRLGQRAVVEKLRRHGLTSEHARRATASVAQELGVDPAVAARDVLVRRRLVGPLQPKDRARAFRLLMSRGFSGEAAVRALGMAALDPEGADD